MDAEQLNDTESKESTSDTTSQRSVSVSSSEMQNDNCGGAAAFTNASATTVDGAETLTKQYLDNMLSSMQQIQPHKQQQQVLQQKNEHKSSQAQSNLNVGVISQQGGIVHGVVSQVGGQQRLLSLTPFTTNMMGVTGTTNSSHNAPAATTIAPTLAAANPQQQQQLLWQQAIQSFNFLPAHQQHVIAPTPLLPLGAAVLPMNLVGLQIPQFVGQSTAAATLAPAQLSSLSPAPIASAQQLPSAHHGKHSTSSSGGGGGDGNKHRNNPSSNHSTKRRKTDGSSSVVSSQSNNFDFALPPTRLSDSALQALSPAQRRRYERNLREQQRSYKISQQIKELRDVLTESSVPFKPNKFSILVSVANYIQELQRRAIMLDADHKKLVETIRQTTELVSSGQVPTITTSSGEDSSGYDEKDNLVSSRPFSCASDSEGDCPDFLLVQGIDYESVFQHCPYPLGVATLDGRVLACNPAFERIMGCEDGQTMVQQSLFLYIRNHQEIFEAMADLLKRSSLASETGEGTVKDSTLLFWCGQVVSSQQLELAFSITLTNMKDGNPKYFSFSVAG